MSKEIKIKRIINFRWTFRKKIFLFFSVIDIIVFFLIFFLIVKHEKEILINDLIKRGRNIVKTFSLSCENTLMLNNELEMEDIVDVTVKEKEVVNAYIVLPDSTYYLHNDRKFLGKKYIYPNTIKIDLGGSYIIFKRNNKIFYQFSNAIYKQNLNGEKKIFGFGYIELTTKYINENINSIIRKILFIFLIVFIISIIISIYFSFILVKPIKRLIKAIQIIGGGNLKYKIMIRTNDELDLLIEEFNSMTKKLLGAQKKLIQQEKTEQELKIAQSIQQKFIPQHLPEIKEYKFNYFYKSSRLVGGDYFNMVRVKNKILFIMADISGKGVPAALIVSVLHTIFSILVTEYKGLSDIIKKLNFQVKKFLKQGSFITMIIGEIYQNRVRFINAGHEYPLIINKNTKEIDVIKKSMVPVGMFEEDVFNKQITQNIIKLDAYNSILMYTDGIKDISSSKPFNNTELLNFLSRILEKENNLNIFYDKLEDILKKKNLGDDVTVFLVRRNYDKDKKK